MNDAIRPAVCPLISTPDKTIICDEGHPVTLEQHKEGIKQYVCVLWQAQAMFDDSKQKVKEFRNCAINHIFKNNLDIYERLNVQVGLLNNIRNKGVLDASPRTFPSGDDEQSRPIEGGEIPRMESG
jgi:hypothetical protein